MRCGSGQLLWTLKRCYDAGQVWACLGNVLQNPHFTSTHVCHITEGFLVYIVSRVITTNIFDVRCTHTPELYFECSSFFADHDVYLRACKNLMIIFTDSRRWMTM